MHNTTWELAQNWKYITDEEKYGLYDILEEATGLKQPFEIHLDYLDFNGDVCVELLGSTYCKVYLNAYNQIVDEDTWTRSQEDFYESPQESDTEDEEEE